VTIDAFDVTDEPLVILVPKLADDCWYIVQVGDHFDVASQHQDECGDRVGGRVAPRRSATRVAGAPAPTAFRGNAA
jgi:hypothetical protein